MILQELKCSHGARGLRGVCGCPARLPGWTRRGALRGAGSGPGQMGTSQEGCRCKTKTLFPPDFRWLGWQGAARAPAVGKGLARCCPQSRDGAHGAVCAHRTQGSVPALAPAPSLPKTSESLGAAPQLWDCFVSVCVGLRCRQSCGFLGLR